MRSDEETKEFIDSKEVITRTELSMFMYGYKKPSAECRIVKWWDYVLQTKDWDKLKKYRTAKINHTDIPCDRYNKIKQIYLTDPRLKNTGKRTTRRILRDVYKICLSDTTVSRYLKKIRRGNETVLD